MKTFELGGAKIKENKAEKSTKLRVVESSQPSVIDDFVELHEKVKNLTTEMDAAKAVIKKEAAKIMADQVAAHKVGNFKISGDSAVVTYIVQDRSSSISQDEYNNFEKKWGTQIADEMIEVDYASFRVNPDVMRDPRKAKIVAEALRILSEQVDDAILLPGGFKTKSGAIEQLTTNKTVKNAIKTNKDIEEMIEDLKLITQIRAS